MSTPVAPGPASPQTPARSDAPRVVGIALVVVLVGTGLLAVQNCAEPPPAQVPAPPAHVPAPGGSATTTSSAKPPPAPDPPPMPPVT